MRSLSRSFTVPAPARLELRAGVVTLTSSIVCALAGCATPTLEPEAQVPAQFAECPVVGNTSRRTWQLSVLAVGGSGFDHGSGSDSPCQEPPPEAADATAARAGNSDIANHYPEQVQNP